MGDSSVWSTVLSAVFTCLGVMPSCVLAQSPKQGGSDTTGLAGEVYADPKGFFKMRPPSGWTVEEADPRGKVNFNWMEGKKVQLKVIGTTNPFRDFDGLVQDCKNGAERLRARMGITYAIETTALCGHEAALIHISMPNGFRQYQLQTILAGNYYTFSYGTDRQLFEKYLPLVKLSIATLEALPKKLSAGEARALAVATKIRLARLYIEVGRRDWALTAVKEGLAIDPENKELLQMKAKL